MGIASYQLDEPAGDLVVPAQRGTRPGSRQQWADGFPTKTQHGDGEMAKGS